MLLTVKLAEDKVLVLVIFREKCENSATLSLTLILTLISIEQTNQINRSGLRFLYKFTVISGIVERHIVVK